MHNKKYKKHGDREEENVCKQTTGDNKRLFWYTRIWYNRCLVNCDRFGQHLNITDTDWIRDKLVVRDLSMSDAVFKFVLNNTL